MDGIELALFGNRVQAICDEMGVLVRRSAFSPNIKDRLDFSCALFDVDGALFGQAAHIPVHLGSMAYAMAGIVARFEWAPDDVVMLNDPYLGGTHLPDVTVVMPAFAGTRLLGFAACRAHHANIGAERPGSMPVSTSLDEEGVVIAPLLVRRDGALTAAAGRLFDALSGRSHDTSSAYRADERLGDFFAQISACRTGTLRLAALADELGAVADELGAVADELGAVADELGAVAYDTAIAELNDYAERLARAAVATIPNGVYTFSDVMDDDGAGSRDVPLEVRLTVEDSTARVDFTASADQVRGNINCPRSVTAAAVLYVFRCLMPAATPAVSGAFRCIEIVTRDGSLLDARRPAAVAAGNVETSMRIVDVVLGALAQALPARIPAASQGTMNNVAMGRHHDGQRWDYYETIAGGAGAWSRGDGAGAIHSHMTNTLNTPVESLETHYPLRVRRYALRSGSGGSGAFRGGDGVLREFEFVEPTAVTLLTERRSRGAYGLAGGEAGQPGVNLLNGAPLAAKAAFDALPGDVLTVMTPGGGGWGEAR